ncbi:MAG: DUF1553 domain-containing protein [Acidobacteriota bacterium]
MRRKVQGLVLLALAGILVAGTIFSIDGRVEAHLEADPGESAAPVGLDFNREVRPILSDKCFQCHGPDEKTRQARLRLDTRDGAMAKAGVIVPGDAAKSRLIQRITTKDPQMVMPPPSSGHQLTEKEVATLTRWVTAGAQWNEHWAYVSPGKVDPPVSANAAARQWIRNSIDAFIWQRLEKEGIKPSPEASRETLLRRASLDLTGLPPTPEELAAFLSDQSPEAWEKVVDRLLASPAYGEKMALHWLDLARYADTHGFHIDSHRVMWPWRDWLIRSFNQNKPFDQFTIEQLAGDLLPNATNDQKIASGFNRNHMINFEGGAIPDEYLNEYIVDRVEATSTTWLGMTMGCARCHTHKYDPISHKEFYQFYAFFNQVPEKGLDGNRGNAMPFLALPQGDQEKRQTELARVIKSHEEELADKEIEPLQRAWESPLLGKPATVAVRELSSWFPLDGSLADASGNYRTGRTINGDPTFGGGIVSRAVTLDGQTELSFGCEMPLDPRRPFTFGLWMRPGLGKVGNIVFEKTDGGKLPNGFEALFAETHLIEIQRWGAHLTLRFNSARGEGIELRTKEVFNTNEWKHLTITADGSGKAAGIRVFINGDPSEVEIRRDNLNGSAANGADLRVGSKETGRAYFGGLDDLRYYDAVLTPAEIRHLAVDYPIQTILSGISGKRTKEESDRLREHFLTRVGPVAVQQKYEELKELRKRKKAIDAEILNVMVMDNLKTPRETFILARGDYRNKTEKVTANVPAVLPPLPSGEAAGGAGKSPNRLTLARWLVDPQHPLTSRVAVNRYWQIFFGQGIVKTSEDFGSQGDQPFHPELLDWLAQEFVRSGWNVKAMHRLIVTSATYRQSSKATPLLLEKDPENRLLARGPRHRLQAELIRDNALAISGLLDQRIGGPSVKPYQPTGLWEEMAFGDGFSEQSYVQSKGADLYRRSMYTFWKRTVPPATLATFDAPDREKCVARRAVTNTPLQALILLNDPTYVEAARVLAQRALREGGRDVNGRLGWIINRAVGRRATAAEMRVLRELLVRQQARYRRDKQAAGALIGVGDSKPDPSLDQAELAAWTIVSSTVLNLDETITKE